MRRLLAIMGLLLCVACNHSTTLPTTPSSLPPAGAPPVLVSPLTTPHDRYIGLTSFRLLELEAHGHADQAQATLSWAASNGVNSLRVLATAVNLFTLTGPDGVRALPALCGAAQSFGEHLEVVALADTNGWDLGQLKNQVGNVASTMAASCQGDRLEIANEPYHPTQDPDLANPATLRDLASLVPSNVPTALGAPQTDTSLIYAGRDYSTVHTARLAGIASVLHLFDVAKAWTGQVVIDDEPIGADQQPAAGARDNDPDDFRARGAVDAVLGIGATFHCQTCLQGGPPAGQELACFKAWREGMDAVRTELGMSASGKSPLAAPVTDCATLADAHWATVVCVGDASNNPPALADGWTLVTNHAWVNLRVEEVHHS